MLHLSQRKFLELKLQAPLHFISRTVKLWLLETAVSNITLPFCDKCTLSLPISEQSYLVTAGETTQLGVNAFTESVEVQLLDSKSLNFEWRFWEGKETSSTT